VCASAGGQDAATLLAGQSAGSGHTRCVYTSGKRCPTPVQRHWFAGRRLGRDVGDDPFEPGWLHRLADWCGGQWLRAGRADRRQRGRFLAQRRGTIVAANVGRLAGCHFTADRDDEANNAVRRT